MYLYTFCNEQKGETSSVHIPWGVKPSIECIFLSVKLLPKFEEKKRKQAKLCPKRIYKSNRNMYVHRKTINLKNACPSPINASANIKMATQTICRVYRYLKRIEGECLYNVLNTISPLPNLLRLIWIIIIS